MNRALNQTAFTPQCVVSALSAMVGLKKQDPGLLEKLSRVIPQIVSEFSLDEISQTLKAMARLQYSAECVTAALFQETLVKDVVFAPKDIALILSAMSRLGHRNQQLIVRLCDESQQMLADFDFQSIAMVLQALAKLNHLDNVLIPKLCKVAIEQANNFSPQAVSGILLAMTKLPHNEPLVAKLVDQVHRKMDSFDSRALTITFRALLTLQHVDKALLQKLLRHCASNSSDFVPREIGSLLNCMAKFQIKQDLDTLCIAARNKIEQFQLGDISNTLNALGRLGYKDENLIAGLCRQALLKNNYNARDIAVIFNALAKLKYVDTSLMDKLCREAIKRPEEFNSQAIANTLNAMTRLKHSDETLVKKLCEQIRSKILSFNSQAVATTFHALLLLQHHDDELISMLRQQIFSKAEHFSSSEISAILTAIAKQDQDSKTPADESLVTRISQELFCQSKGLDMWRIATNLNMLARIQFRDEILVARLCEEAKMLIETGADNATALVPSDIACIMNALAKINHKDHSLLKMLGSKALEITMEFNSQEIATILNAITKLGHSNMALVMKFSEVAVDKLDEFNPQEISITLNALARLRLVDNVLVPLLCGRVFLQTNEFKWHQLSSAFNSLAELEYSNEELLSKLCNAALPKINEFSVQAIANTVHAMAKLQYKNDLLMKRLCEEMASKITSFECHSLTTTLWSLLCCQHYEKDTIQLLWSQLFRLDMAFTKDEDLRNLHQSQLSLSIERPEWRLLLPSGLCERASNAWKKRASLPSRFQMEVSSILLAMNIEHVNETECGQFFVDLAIKRTVGHVVIEVDGPRHFINFHNSEGKQEGVELYNGNSAFKQRLLEAQGIMVVRVPYFEWNKLRGKQQKMAYLHNKLNPWLGCEL